MNSLLFSIPKNYFILKSFLSKSVSQKSALSITFACPFKNERGPGALRATAELYSHTSPIGTVVR
ncbi:MAG: hypothetical protein WC521_06665, partial [Bdellovibrionales bacterium]